MCYAYEAAPHDYLEREWNAFMDDIGDYKPILGPRDDGPFITAKYVRVIIGHISETIGNGGSGSDT